jgi:hypothetical protein
MPKERISWFWATNKKGKEMTMAKIARHRDAQMLCAR